MNVEREFQVYLTVTDDGTYLAATNESPHFCFEGSSEQELLATVEQALTFYYQNRGRADPAPVAPAAVRRFVPNRVIGSKEIRAVA